jgi:hypothetical protein
MTAPDPMSILAVVVITAAVYKVIYWRADHPRKNRAAAVAPPAQD